MEESYLNLVARALCSENFLKLCHLCHLLTFDACDNIAFLDTSILSSSTLINLRYIDTVVCAKVNILLLCFLIINVTTYISTTNAKQATLHLTILLQIGYYFIHNSGRDSKAIACEVTSLRVEHCIDTDELTLHVYKGTTRITCIDGSIGLDECLNTVSTK